MSSRRSTFWVRGLPLRLARSIAILAIATVFATGPAFAADFTVLNTGDAGADTLRDIIETVPALPGDRVLFSPAVAGGTITLAALLDVTQDPLELQLGVGALTIAGASLQLDGALTVNTLTAVTDVLTISAPVSGAGTIIKEGAGQLILSGTNTRTGGTTINAGALLVQNGDALADGAVVTVNAGVLQLSASETIGSLAGAGAGAVGLAANTLTAGGDNSSTTFAGQLAGVGGGLTKAGTGTLTLSGTNIYTGATSITAGILLLQGGAAIENGSAVTVDAGAALQLDASETIGSLAGAGDVILGANTLTAGGNNSSTTYFGAASGTGGLTKTGNGVLTLAGANAYTGATSITAGVLLVQGGAAIADVSAVTVDAGAILQLGASEAIGSLAGAGDVNLGANSLTAGGNDSSTTFSGVASGTGGLTKVGAGVLTLTGANTYTGGTIVAAGTLSGNTVSLQGVIQDNATVVFDQATDGTYAGVMSGNGTLTKAGAGTLTLSGANTYTGATSITAGVLLVQGGAAIADVSAVTVGAGATLQLSASETIGSLAGAGSLNLGTNTLTAGGDNLSTTFSGVASGTGGFTKAGTGVLTLSGANTYTGATTINGGTLLAQGGAAIANVSAVTVIAGSTLQLGAGETIASLAGAGNVNLGAFTLTTGDNTSTTFSGVMSGTGALVKSGSGIFQLLGANTYSGGTTINAGVLDGNSTSLQGNMVVNAGAALKFNQVAAGTFAGNVSGAGQLAKAGAGNLTLTGANSYTGGTSVGAGTLTGSTTSLQGAIQNSAAVVFDQAVAGTYAGVMSGTGSLTKQGVGNLTLSGGNTYTGGTTVAAGTLTGTTTSLQGAIANNAAVVFDQAANGTYAGVMSGTGTLTKAGAGTLSLTGANTYSGGTTIAAGTLSGDTTSLQGNIANTSALVFDQALDGAYNGVISGIGTVAKQGAGTLTFNANQTYTGLTSVNVGRLAVNGTIQSDIDVATGAELGGTGTLNNLTVRGTLAPGNSIGTTVLAGNLTQVAGSSFEVEIDAAGNGDKVTVGGTATIQPGVTVNVLAAPGAYTLGQQYTILTAAGGVSGTYSAITDDLAFFDALLIHQSNAVLIELLRNASNFQGVAATLNQRGVGQVLDAVSARAPGDLGAVLDVVLQFNANATRDVLEQLGGEIHADLPTVVLQDFTTVNHTVNRRLRTITPAWVDEPPGPALRGGGPVAHAAAAASASVASPYVGLPGLGNDSVKEPWSAWFEGYGFRTRVDGDGNGHELSFDGHGGLLGFDRTFGLRTLGGLFLGTSRTDAQVEGHFDDADVETFRLGIYGRRECERYSVTGILSWADNDFDVRRRLLFGGIDRATSTSYGGHGLSAFVEVGTRLDHGGWNIEPTASVQYAHIQAGGFGETGASSLNVIGNQVNADSVLGSLGARVTYPTETSQGRRLVPELRARWMHEFRDGDARLFTGQLEGAAANPFTVAGTDPGRDFAVLGGGVTMQTGDTSHVYVSYDAQLNDQQDTHTGEAGFRITF